MLCSQRHRSGSDVGKKRRAITEETKNLARRIQGKVKILHLTVQAF